MPVALRVCNIFDNKDNIAIKCSRSPISWKMSIMLFSILFIIIKLLILLVFIPQLNTIFIK